MSTFCISSVIVPLPLSVIWNSLRFFDFPRKYLRSVIEKVDVSGPTDIVGCTRNLVWKTGESQVQRLVHLSDYEHSLKWELVESTPAAEVTAIISKIKLYRITEDNSTLLEWSAEYSSDVSQKLISFSQESFYDNLIEIRAHLIEENGDLPVLHHIREGASSRIVWLSYELGIPLNIKEASSVTSSTEAPSDLGGLVSCYREANIELIESGAILQYLLEKHDGFNTLLPKIGTMERVKYLKYLFYTSSTMDHLLMESYKELFVKETPDQNVIKSNKEQWNNFVVKELEEDLKKHKYIAGNKFTAADIMVGYSLYLANLVGWLQDSSQLVNNYWKLLNQRSYCKKALHLQ